MELSGFKETLLFKGGALFLSLISTASLANFSDVSLKFSALDFMLNASISWTAPPSFVS